MRAILFWVAFLSLGQGTISAQQLLPGTKPLETKGDLARHMLDGIDRFFDKQLQASIEKRRAGWKLDFSSNQAYFASIQPQRDRLRKIIGVVDSRPEFGDLETIAQLDASITGPRMRGALVRWPALPGMATEGILLEPVGKIQGGAIVIPDADQTPEQIAGFEAGLPASRQTARRLAEQGWVVLIPTLIDRQDTHSGNPRLGRFTNQPHREFVYRMAYEMGRHVIGYEVQKVLAGVDWMEKTRKFSKIGVWGWSEGGLIALYSAASDVRITETHVSGYVQPREKLHREPIYRHVWSLLRDFGDAELLLLAGSPFPGRSLEVEANSEVVITGPPSPRPGRSGAAPGTLGNLKPSDSVKEWERFIRLQDKASFRGQLLKADDELPLEAIPPPKNQPMGLPKLLDPAKRQQRQVQEAIDFTHRLMPEATRQRQERFWAKLDTRTLPAFEASQKPLREKMLTDLIGKLPEADVPMNPRTRLVYDTPRWKGYEVVLDIYEDVIAFGILLVPNDLKPGERRPVVVCQHGLEGRPSDVVDPTKKTKHYNSFGAQLADQGYIVFAPQNPYLFQNDFRQIVRKAQSLGYSHYAVIVRQHQRILEFLATLPFVDAGKIAFYGLSYGGKVAMRIPALLEGYCLSICSGDFNEWIWKNVTLDWTGSYMFTGEYEMYEFDLANTFSYAEMAALIAPRPFMVERGHDDGVGLDEYVAFEYAKVRRLYTRLGIADRTAIEFFQGGHEIHGQGTFAFLRQHLQWPR